jgi:hypothetical protein
MKKITLLIFLISLMNKSYSQGTYFNYFDYTSEWRYYASGWTGLNGFDSYETVYFDGDITINGNVYYKQYRKTVETNYNHPFLGTYTENFLYGPGYVREDSNGKVWYLASDNTEQLYFDNQLISASQIGDPFPSQGASGGCLVQSIQMEMLGGTQLKHVFGSNTTLKSGTVEGIGDLGYACGMGIEYNRYLNCYSKQTSNLQFGTLNCNLFPIPLRVNLSSNSSNFEEKINVYPNPTNGILNVKIESGMTKTEFKIYNCLGKLMQEGYLEEENSRIDFSTLNTGVYFLKINSESLEINKKIIKI